ncbi:TonB-dependent receptor [Aliiglaciecola sp. 3_MG-2023]|uniref:TonB-dependent receptor n=1 Tax=Aliiglaciecola sp. 3_MG-2023 TaxID=3062644 RepID=UPI0026E485B2|nr:TonB-dependent receptor [Aliiglaciecola sp. 3_MG-2023]MDO6694499.1 TonB-dependent receptor [Aliiglaciecola sp. 3_MG-2023]
MFNPNKLRVAICCACLGSSTFSYAQTEATTQDKKPKANAIEKISVTATRRETTIQEVPYSISAYGGEALENAGVTDFSAIARSIPGLTLTDVGRGKNGISSGIVMRGLNLTGGAQEDFAMTTDPVVSVYLGETPLFANLELRDMNRVEVLKGPQSTLYGSGSLGGTMRYIPNKPEFDKVSGKVQAKVSSTDGAGDLNHDLEFTLNVPLSDTFAVRGVVTTLKNGGYIDSDYIAGLDENKQPTGEYQTAEDINDEDVSMARISARWLPTDETEILLTHNYQKDEVQGSSATSEGLGGYKTAAKILEQFERETSITSLVIEHELGFADLTSATSFTSNEAENMYDQSYNYGHSTWWGPYYVSYYGYTGGTAPASEIIVGEKTYKTDTITQEFRLTGSTDANTDWLLGVYYNSVDFEAEAYDYVYGLDEAFNITNPVGTDVGYGNLQETEFEDYAIFGEVTYYPTDQISVTAGLRYFEQSFYAKQEVLLPACEEFWNTTLGFFTCGDVENSGIDPRGYAAGEDEKDFSDLLYRFNVAYDVNFDTKVYLNISQGFRHGGANGLPTTGIFAEGEEYLFFEPDKSTNYEVGVKGSLLDGDLYYSATAYYIDWEDPIMLVQSPNGGFPAMINAQSAESKGVEIELNANLSDNLKLNFGYTYTKAELTEEFTTPDGNFGAADGETLPGIPESTIVSSLLYTQEVGEGVMTAQIGVSYKDEFVTGYAQPSIFYETSYDEIPASTLWNASVRYDVEQWSFSVFADNLFNADDPTASDGDGKYIIDAAAGEVKAGEQYDISQLGDQLYRVRPRTVGATVSYKF